MKELICSPKIYKSSLGVSSLEKFKRMNRHAGSKPRFGFVVHLASGTTAMVTKRKRSTWSIVPFEGSRGILGNLCNGRA